MNLTALGVQLFGEPVRPSNPFLGIERDGARVLRCDAIEVAPIYKDLQFLGWFAAYHWRGRCVGEDSLVCESPSKPFVLHGFEIRVRMGRPG